MDTEKPQHIDGPATDILSRNLVLQQMGEEVVRKDWEIYENERRMLRGEALTGTNSFVSYRADDGSKLSDEDIETLESLGIPFQHTQEYYGHLEAEEARRRAYREITVANNVPEGEEAEIAADPFKFLFLDETATFAQVRDTYIRLSKLWHPDLVYPENPEQFKLIFGIDPFPLEGVDRHEWIAQLSKLVPPQTLTVEELGKLPPEKQEEYNAAKEAYRQKELEYEKVKAEMRLRATVKMQIINKAYTAAKKRFSKEEVESFGGYDWETQKFSGLRGMINYKLSVFNLEGEGQLRRALEFGDTAPYLAYDFGDVYLADQHDYRQHLDLQTFFAWSELVQGKGIAPSLLGTIAKEYSLDADRTEQLRVMLMHYERPSFILDTLGIPYSGKGINHSQILYFIDELYHGPNYFHQIGIRTGVNYKLGVEFTPEGGMVLQYTSQEEQAWSDYASKDEAHFTPTDVRIMRSLAYGPMLQEPDDE